MVGPPKKAHLGFEIVLIGLVNFCVCEVIVFAGVIHSPTLSPTIQSFSIIAAAAKLSANSRQNCVSQAPKVELSKTNLLFTNESFRNEEHVSFLPISDSVPAADAWPISFLVVLLLANGARAKLAPSLPPFLLCRCSQVTFFTLILDFSISGKITFDT